MRLKISRAIYRHARQSFALLFHFSTAENERCAPYVPIAALRAARDIITVSVGPAPSCFDPRRKSNGEPLCIPFRSDESDPTTKHVFVVFSFPIVAYGERTINDKRTLYARRPAADLRAITTIPFRTRRRTVARALALSDGRRF